MDATPAVMTIREAGTVLACSDDTIRRRLADGSLTPVKIGPTTRVLTASVRAYIDEAEERFRQARSRLGEA